MGRVADSISDRLASWIAQQPMFFVATAPLSRTGHINCSPKGLLDTFVVLDSNRVAYLDLTGSGVETISHIRENGRVTVMFCAFEGKPNIVRLYGIGSVVLPGDDEFDDLVQKFADHPGVRAVITVEVARVSESCGFSVPLMDYQTDRDILDRSSNKRGPAGLVEYRRKNNAQSIDGLPGL